MTNFPKSFLPSELAAAKLMQDRRVGEAKRLLREAVGEYQKKLTGVRPGIPELKQSYDAMLAEMSNLRGAPLWFPFLGSGLGNGALVELADGSVKYDFICGIGPHYFGHSHADFIDSSVEAAISDTIMQGNLQQNVDSLELSALLVKASGMDHCFLTSSGAMANENALKIAFQKRYPAYRILAFEHCFAGRSLATSQITDKPAYREGLPINYFVDYVPFFDHLHPEESTVRAVDALKKYIARYPKEHALMCFEFVQGEGGFYSGTKEFYKKIIAVLKENQIAVFADEIQSFARTPQLFAYQYFDLQSSIDIASCGKISQVCATFFSDEYKPKLGLLSQTFTGSTSAIKASIVILNSLLKDGYFGPSGKIQKLHNHFVSLLEALSKKYPKLIQGPFGTGCMVAFTPYDGDAQRVTNFVRRLFDRGVMGFIAGGNPTRIRFLIPAGAITYDDIDKAVNIIEETLLQQA